MTRERLKLLGLYVLAVLMILRVVISPLQHSLSEKKELFKEYEDTYRMRMMSVVKYKAQEKEKNKETAAVEEGFLNSLYADDVPYSILQAEVVEKISALAEKQGLTVANFDFAEPTSMKYISDVPVGIRINGEQKGIVALLRALEKDSKKLVVRRFEVTRTGQYSSQCSMTVS